MKKLASLFLFCTPWLVQAQIPAFLTDSIDQFMNREMARWQIPGAAIAIVKDGQILISKGYGMTDLENGHPVNDETLFMIASNSKAFTGTSLALLQDEGKLHLDDHVTDYLPWLDLYDDCATDMVSIKDMVTHRIGLQTFQGDFLHWGSNLSRRELLEKMDVHQPQYDFRSGYGYCNMGFVAAGEIIGEVSGMSWDDFVSTRIFSPLHMKRSSTTYEAIIADKNACSAYTLNQGNLEKIPYENINNLGPAASINSCVKDLSNWLIMNSQEGSFEGKQLFPASVIEAATTPYNIVSENRGGLYAAQHFELYGLGWFMADYNGKKMVWHDGGANGFVTTTCFLPELDLGIVVLTNTDENWFYEAMKMQVIEAFLDMPYRNISEMYNTFYVRSRKRQAEETQALLNKAHGNGAAAKHALNEYAGNYISDVYGMASIKLEDGMLHIYFEHHPDLSGTLEPLGGNDFVCTYNQSIYGIKQVSFDEDEAGISAYHMTVADFIDMMEYTFHRVRR